MRVVVGILALLLLAIGLRWLQLFIFTDYRAHLRHMIIPMGIVAVAVGGLMLWWSLGGLRRRGGRAR